LIAGVWFGLNAQAFAVSQRALMGEAGEKAHVVDF
jgi:hypothetical protein